MNSPPATPTDELFAFLLSAPRRVELTSGQLELAGGLFVPEPRGAPARLLDERLRARQPRLASQPESRPSAAPVPVHFGALASPIEGDRLGLGYRLQLERELRIESAGEAGAFAAVASLTGLLDELARRAQTALGCARVEDWPSFERRGFMLDISRDRVPTQAFLRELVERLSLWQFNELQLYTEHSFAYARHELVWRGKSPMTGAELRELDELCRARGIELVPNQNSLGHWHRWLRHPEYRHLAECPEGVEHAFSLDREPFSLCPGDARSLELLEELYDELLPNFHSREFNVGLDETFDVGLGRSRARCAQLGKGRVYLDFLRAVHARIAQRGHRMQFWGDVIVTSPELVPELPQDAIALEWGYEAGHPFDEHAACFAASGLDFHVCPGTSSWQSLSGRIGNAEANTREAARAGLAAGARGYLLTDWGDYGHWQPFSLSWPGLALGALRAWSGPEARIDALPARLGAALFGDSDSGVTRLLWRLGRVHERVGTRCVNGTPFFFLLKFLHEPVRSARVPGLALSGLVEAAIELESLASDARESCFATPAQRLVAREIAWSAELCLLASRIAQARLGLAADAPARAIAAGPRESLRCDFRALIEEHTQLWGERSRAGGLAESRARLERSLACLEGA